MATSMAKPAKAIEHFDYNKLVKTFVSICPDFKETQLRKSLVSKQFAEKVIFECSKDAKLAKTKAKKDAIWKIRLEVLDKERNLVENTVVISTYFFKPPPAQQPVLLHNHLQLSFKQASLLAVDKYCKLLPQLLRQEKTNFALTPLAGAVFSREKIEDLVRALSEYGGRRVQIEDVLKAIISSCQTDGYHLEYSRCHIAVVALNRTIADQKVRDSLIKKTIKMYRLLDKHFDMEMFKIYDRHAHEYLRVKRQGRVEQFNKQTSGNDVALDELLNQIRIESLVNSDILNGRNLSVLTGASDIKCDTISCLKVCGVAKADKKRVKCAANLSLRDEQGSSTESSSDEEESSSDEEESSSDEEESSSEVEEASSENKEKI